MRSFFCCFACCLCVWLGACHSPSSTEEASDTTLVQADTLPLSPLDTIPADTTAPYADTTITYPDTLSAAPPSTSLFTKKFTGTIRGFESRTYAFSLTSPLALHIQAVPASVVFKLYQTTATLPEGIQNEELSEWTGELDPGNYQLKVFLPLKKAAKKTNVSFQLTIQESTR